MGVVALIQPSERKVNIGIEERHRQKVAEELTHFLASSYVLYLKTLYYHWNVTGPHFQSLHTMFEEHYNNLAVANDEIAERIRALGYVTPGSLWAFSELSEIKEDKQLPKDAASMVDNLVNDHETMARLIRSQLEHADNAGDEVTLDLYTQRLTWHEKTAWMLRSYLE